ncbi:MAG TPA: hypothetical protein VMT64_06605, partial [Candidatus Binataceae bacterium]|nr:hypothetical protein [Candidatus Binataceae bacterium]
MGRVRESILIAVGILIAGGWTVELAQAADAGGKKSSSAMEARLEALERQNRLLEEQNRAIQGQLSNQKSEIDALRQQLQVTAQPVASLQKEVPELREKIADAASEEPDVQFGFRVGWSESAYGMPGGVSYGVYTQHRLLSPEDGLPGGVLTGELMTGYTQGNHATTSGTLLTVLTRRPAIGWLDTIAIEPTLQYHLEPALLGYRSLEAVRPYFLVGPGVWINLMSSP